MENILYTQIRKRISNAINLNLFSGDFEDVFDLIESDLEISNLNEAFQLILMRKSQIRNLGVDLPLSFGTIGQLYKGLGIITNNASISEIGEDLISNRSVENILKFQNEKNRRIVCVTFRPSTYNRWLK